MARGGRTPARIDAPRGFRPDLRATFGRNRRHRERRALRRSPRRRVVHRRPPGVYRAAVTATRIELAGLRAAVIGPDDAARTAVFLHGFGASGDDLVPLARELAVRDLRFVFPAAPLELGG